MSTQEQSDKARHVGDQARQATKLATNILRAEHIPVPRGASSVVGFTAEQATSWADYINAQKTATPAPSVKR